MAVAYAILLGHSIIPHHHHDSELELTEHHQTDHHYNEGEGSEEGEGLRHILSHFIHSADAFTFVNTLKISSMFYSVIAILPYNFSFDGLLIPPLLYKPPAEHFIYNSPHSLSSGLRAPPAFIG